VRPIVLITNPMLVAAPFRRRQRQLHYQFDW
jgi:hypothetical protein